MLSLNHKHNNNQTHTYTHTNYEKKKINCGLRGSFRLCSFFRSFFCFDLQKRKKEVAAEKKMAEQKERKVYRMTFTFLIRACKMPLFDSLLLFNTTLKNECKENERTIYYDYSKWRYDSSHSIFLLFLPSNHSMHTKTIDIFYENNELGIIIKNEFFYFFIILMSVRVREISY